MYLQNKYTRCYYSIIDRAKTRTLSSDIYTELHHIIPKSLGGSNLKENLVKLTAKEHFICHLLLTKMTNHHAMVYAAWKMSNQTNEHQERYKINSSIYAMLRKKFSVAKSLSTQSEEARRKNSESHKGIRWSSGMTGKTHSKETITKMKQAGLNRVVSEETKQKLSEINKGKPGTFTGRKHTPETRAKMKLAQQKRRNEIYIDSSNHK